MHMKSKHTFNIGSHSPERSLNLGNPAAGILKVGKYFWDSLGFLVKVGATGIHRLLLASKSSGLKHIFRQLHL